MDYRGYGGNPGSPTEDGLAKDALAAARGLGELGYPAAQTIYFGESLGSAVVAALQARRPPAGVALRSPFPELADVGAHHYPWLPVRLLLEDRFRTVEPLSRSEVPVTVIYGDRDSVVPPELSARVADEAPTSSNEWCSAVPITTTGSCSGRAWPTRSRGREQSGPEVVPRTVRRSSRVR